MSEDREGLKRAAAARALDEVRSGMRLGLGTGSTVAHFLDLLGERIREGAVSDVAGVPTSVRTAEHAERLGITLAPLHELAPLDLTVDGADEIDPRLRLIKGLGGALLREKMVAEASREMIVIGDESKTVARLGERAPLPVEVVPFAWESHLPFLERLGARPELRLDRSGRAYTTDNGNHVLDCRFETGIDDPEALDAALGRRTGVVASGLFLGLASLAFVAEEGRVRALLGDGEGG